MLSGELPLAHTRGRDLRLDFIRGIALYTVLVDHIIGDPIGHFTYRVLGFSDAAEIFVFVSGLTCGIVYHRLLCTNGWRSLFDAVGQRAARIYVCYALTSLVILGLVAVSHASFNPTLSAVASDPVRGALQVLVMHYSPPVSGILILYIPLTLIVMPLFFLTARCSALGALCISGSVWVAAQVHPDFGAALTERTWFNVFAWQFLFAIGLLLGMQQPERGQKPIFEKTRVLAGLAWAVVVACFLYRLAIYLSPHISPRVGFDLEAYRMSIATIIHMKETLAPLRLLHFLSVAFLVSTYFRRDSVLLHSSVARPLVYAGQRSLEMFAISAVLSMAANAYIVPKGLPVPARLAIDGVMLLVMVLIAFATARSSRKRAALVSKQA